MALEPITRQEKIIAGQDLTPITRMEMFLKQYGGGGSVGGSVPKPLTYDYMPEGYPKKSVQTTTLMEEQELAFSLTQGIYLAELAGGFLVAAGQTYTVKWDGAEYECVGVDLGEGMYALGNLSISGSGADTGEPFVYLYLTAGAESAGQFITLDTSASHNISIKKMVETVTPMADEFIPNIPADKLPATAKNTTVFYI